MNLVYKAEGVTDGTRFLRLRQLWLTALCSLWFIIFMSKVCRDRKLTRAG